MKVQIEIPVEARTGEQWKVMEGDGVYCTGIIIKLPEGFTPSKGN